MLNKNEIKILEKMIEILNSEFTLIGMAKSLNQKYSQTYASIENIMKMGLINVKKVGKSKVIQLDFLRYHAEYAIVEMERTKKIVKNKEISKIFGKILDINKQFICILFGSYASGQYKKDSDIDLLFIVPEEYDLPKFEKIAKQSLSIYNVDISIITENSLFEMWSNPKKLNVGNELFKRHVVLVGADQFMNLVRKYYVGR